MDSSSGESWIAGDELGKRFAMQLHVEQAPTSVPLPKGKDAHMMHKGAVKMSDQYQTATAGDAAKRAKAKKAKEKPASKAEEAAKMPKAKAEEAAKMMAKAKAEDADKSMAKAKVEDAGKMMAKAKVEDAGKSMAKAKADDADKLTTKLKAEESAMMVANAKAEEAATIAKAKAEDAAKLMAKAKAEEAAMMVAKAKAEEAAKIAKEKAEYVARLRAKVKAREELAWVQCYEELFASEFRDLWETHFAHDTGDTFEQTTPIPAMRYTHCAPDDDYDIGTAETLMITSVKLASVNACLSWPLQVFGIVAARDVLDRKRNIIFHRTRDNCQSITKDDPYLALTGPSRAVVVSVDPSYIEVSLKVKGTVESEDKDLSELVVVYRSELGLCCPYPSRLSTLEFQHVHIDRSVEATIYVKVTGGSWPDGFRGVFSAGSSYIEWKIKLLDFRDDGLPVDDEGMIKLSRRVVSVELEKDLIVSVMACPVNKEQVVESSKAAFPTETAGISPGIELNVGSCSMEVTVAWSLFNY